MAAFIALFAALGITEIWLVDFEYGTGPNRRPIPVCMAALELITGKVIRFWMTELTSLTRAPFNVGKDALFVAYAAAAEMDCFLELKWPVPYNILCMWTEYIMVTNGKLKRPQNKTGLIHAQTYYRQAAIAFEEKEEMRDLAQYIAAGGSHTDQDRHDLQRYNFEDIDGMRNLIPPMMEEDLARFHPREMLLRGRATIAQARIYRVGISVDAMLAALSTHRAAIAGRVARAAEEEHDWKIFDVDGAFSHAGYEAYLKREGIKIPFTATGQSSVADAALEKMEARLAAEQGKNEASVHKYKTFKALRATIKTLGSLDRFKAEINEDGRLRVYANPYGSDTLRNQPSTAEHPFSWPKWKRYFLKPERGYGLFYLDAKGQEFLIGAAASGCQQMLHDYYTGDVHLAAAKNLSLAPPDATKKSHPTQRRIGKGTVYGQAYGQSPYGLQQKIGGSLDRSIWVQRRYRRSYAVYYQWIQGILNGLKLKKGTYYTAMGSPLWTAGKNRRQMMNHPLQAAGSDWLRLVMIGCTECGIGIAATAHDALLGVSPLDRIDQDVECVELIMKAAAIVLYGKPVLVERQVVRWPDRFDPSDDDDTAEGTWNLVMRELEAIQATTEEAQTA